MSSIETISLKQWDAKVKRSYNVFKKSAMVNPTEFVENGKTYRKGKSFPALSSVYTAVYHTTKERGTNSDGSQSVVYSPEAYKKAVEALRVKYGL